MIKSFTEIKSTLIRNKIHWSLLCGLQDSYMDNGESVPASLFKCRKASGDLLGASWIEHDDHPDNPLFDPSV